MLTTREQQILNFAEHWDNQPQPQRELATQQTLGIRHTQYQQALNKLLDRQDAIAAHPMLVYRLRERRERGLEERQARLIVDA